MKSQSVNRREFLRSLGAVGIGGSMFAVALPRTGRAGALEIPLHRTMESMGGLVNIDIFGEKEALAREAAADAFAEVRRVDDLMSVHRAFTQLSRLNRAAGNDMIDADARLLDVLRASLRWSALTAGKFDVTTLPLLKAWGFREEATDAPASVAEARSFVNFKRIAIEGARAGLETRRGGIDLGAIAKGYAVDRAVAVLRDKWGVRKAIVEAAGDLYCLGHPDDAAGWRIALQDPRGPGAAATFELRDQAVGTSGNYEGTIEIDGRRIADKFDPATGAPAATCLSASVVGPTCMDADAASTSLFMIGSGLAPTLEREGMGHLRVTAAQGGGLEFSASKGFPELRIV